MTRSRPVLAGFGAIALSVAVLAGCSEHNDERGRGDAPVGPRDDSPARIINMPDQFSNIAIKCDRGNGIYVSTREAPPVVVANDPNCPQPAR